MNTQNEILKQSCAEYLFLHEKIDKLQTIKTQLYHHVEILHDNIKILEEKLASVGLEISSISFRKTGSDYNVWTPEDHLRVSVSAQQIPGNKKFKFLTFRGYTNDGRGKNDKALHEKASKLEKELHVFEFGPLHVNFCSLEIDERETVRLPKSILIEFYIKVPGPTELKIS